QRTRQRRDGELVLDHDLRARGSLRDARRCEGQAVRLRRGILQPGAQALDAGVHEPRRVREGSTDGAGSSVINLSTKSGQAHGYILDSYPRQFEALSAVVS